MKNRLIISVSSLIALADFLMLSAGPLMLSADAIRKSTSSLIVLAREKRKLFALSLSCAALWASWKEKSGNSIDVFNPRIFTKGAKEHESAWGSDGSDRSDKSDQSDLSENPS